MPVFKNGINDYQLDFSDRTADRLLKLSTSDQRSFKKLSAHLTDNFSWLFSITTDFPILKTGFATLEEAQAADQALHLAIYNWLREPKKAKKKPGPKPKPVKTPVENIVSNPRAFGTITLEIPSSCRDCQLFIQEFYYCAGLCEDIAGQMEWLKNNYAAGRPDWCPIKPTK